MDKYLVVMAGAAFGGLARFVVASVLTERIRTRFPIGTFLVNITGCFLIGIVMTLLLERFPQRVNWRYFLVTGFLGGYTTFSSFEWETVIAAQSKDWIVALGNAIGSVVLGFLATGLGVLLATRQR